MPSLPSTQLSPQAIYIHPMIFTDDDFRMLDGVLAAFDNCDGVFYWPCLTADYINIPDC